MSRTRIQTVCPHDCPDTCGMVVDVEDGRAVHVGGDPDHPITQGWLCAKVRPYLDHVYHPDRLQHPLRRLGPKGSGQWEQISWDAAIAEIVERWQAIIAEYGAEAILPYSYSGTLGLVQMSVASARLWNRLGASQLQRSICGAAAEMAVELTLGRRWSASYEEVLHSKLVLLWGHNPISTAPHFMPHLLEAKRHGCQVVVIDPRHTLTAEKADWHLAPLPGTDGYLAMGIANVLLREKWHDEAWLQRQTVGWPQFRERIDSFTPEVVAERTGLRVADVERLAHLYGTIRPGLIRLQDGINRNRNGGQNVRAILSLPAMTGQYGVRGGGLAYSTSGYLQWDRGAVGHGAPRTRAINMNRLGAALLGETTDPPIQSLFVFGANPATSSPNAQKIVEGMKRPDLFTVVHELFMTDTAHYADLVLPATSQLEQVDLHKAYGHTRLAYNHQAIQPLGESKSNWDVMRLLAEGMGFKEPWLHQTVDEVIEEVLAATARHNPFLQGITLAQLKAQGSIPLRVPEYPPYQGGAFPTPSGKVEIFCQALADQGLDPLPGSFRMDEDDGGQWGPREESLWLVTGASHHFVSSSLASQAGLLQNAGPASVEIHPDDAATRGIKDGDVVEVVNGRGGCALRAVVTPKVRPGVIVSPKGRWGRFGDGRNVNWTTPDELADFNGQSTFHGNRVWVRRG